MVARRLEADYPRIKVDEDRIFINDGQLWISRGMSADQFRSRISRDYDKAGTRLMIAGVWIGLGFCTLLILNHSA